MPTLRSHVKRALARTEPSPEEAARMLAVIQEHDGSRARSRARIVLALAPVVIAALVVVVLHRRRPVEPPPPVAMATGIHLYLRVDGEPPEKAVTLDLVQNGEH